ncbi:MAG: hypothetical protein HKN91_16030 [Acidimicrobiia bacterium]|nr:hypothetical protein [Acidimicrobiia bacterium]
MFYAASEIVFWILLAAVIGGGIGYGLSQAKMVRLNKRLAQGRADAPLERELAIAWDTIEDLNKRLQVAHETIRDTISEPGDPALAAVEDSEDTDTDQPVDEDAELDRIVAEKMSKAEKAKTEKAKSGGNGDVGSRLSERVASASRSKSVDFTDGLEG